jgi:hypothetical protein
MEPIGHSAGRGTSIPARFVWERERILKMLSRWEEETLGTAIRVGGQHSGPVPQSTTAGFR